MNHGSEKPPHKCPSPTSSPDALTLVSRSAWPTGCLEAVKQQGWATFDPTLPYTHVHPKPQGIGGSDIQTPIRVGMGTRAEILTGPPCVVGEDSQGRSQPLAMGPWLLR